MKCPICSSNRIEVIFRLDKQAGKLWKIYECEECLMRFIYPAPSPQELKQVYDQFYTQSDAQAKTLYNPRYGWLTFRRQWGIIRSLVHKKRNRILDFGCGGGHFLDNVDPGWDKYGIDLSEDARKVATQKGIKTFATLEEAAFADEFFDVVIMFAIIEHLPDPRDVVERLSKVLRSGGLFAIMTGDVTSLKARKRAERWHMYCPPEHIYFFSAQSLDFLMDSLGFKRVKSLYTDGGMTQISFWPLNIALRISLMIYETIPVLNSLPLFDHYYGYYQKR